MPLQRKVSKRKVSRRKVSKRKVSKRKINKRKISKRKTFRRKSTCVHKQKRRNTKRVKLRGGNGYQGDVDSPIKKRRRETVPMDTRPPTRCEEELKTEYKKAQELLTTQVGISSKQHNEDPTCQDHLRQLKNFNRNFERSVVEQIVQ